VRILVVFVVGLLPGFARAEAPEWIGQSAAELRSKAGGDPAALVEALGSVWKKLRSGRAVIRPVSALDPLVEVLAEIASSDDSGVRDAAWRAAAAACHEKALAILTDGMKRPDGARGLARAVADSNCGAAHAWLVQHVAVLWKEPAPPELREALRVSVFTMGSVDVSDGARRGARDAAAAFKKTLRATKGPLEIELVLALALTPGKSTRQTLKKWLKDQKSVEQKTLLAVIAALGKSADEHAIPILLDRIEGTAPEVLEAVLVALFELPPVVLTKSGKLILGKTMDVAMSEGRAARNLTAKSKRNRKEEAELALYTARSDGWHTRKILDTPPKPLPSGATGIPGIHALWWRIIDARPKGLRPPKPSSTAHFKYMNGRPNLTGDEWLFWWKANR
jgi:hypothetical protein